MKKIIIAIDGYSACGKSSTAKAVSQALGYLYLDSGAMYRAATLYFIQNGVALDNAVQIVKSVDQIDISFEPDLTATTQKIILNGINVEKQIRTMEVSSLVSEVSTIPEVRHAMVAIQRQLSKGKGVVMDGRDIGTVVFPDAELKIFMTADLDIRARRRQLELLQSGQMVELDEVKDNLIRRDLIDTTREISPLKKAPDAIEIDTTKITLDQQIEMVVELALERIDSL